ncbi:MAG: hypothetical protein LLG97_01525 [Deltaproteobacteria bacterium]|nr:hypothetical protein [Deltaproteobacteria bacterium]
MNRVEPQNNVKTKNNLTPNDLTITPSISAITPATIPLKTVIPANPGPRIGYGAVRDRRRNPTPRMLIVKIAVKVKKKH